MTEQEKKKQLDIIAQFNDLKPMYDLAIQQLKNELLESAKQADTVELPNGTQLLLKRKKEYERKSVDTVRLKKERPEIAEEFTKTTKIAESVNVEVLYPTETPSDED